MPLSPGTMLTPSIRIERELGAGGMGAVWVARNLALDTPVAVKVLRGAGESRARFQQEARGLAKIDSPHVVKVFDFGVTADDEPFIVMELLQGRDLRAHIEEKGALGLDETLTVVTQTARALAAAHAQRIVHRDIKPANIFLTASAQGPFVKVLDFGVAKFLGDDLGMTTTGALMGTPYYASPEQLLTPKDVDHRTDLWSLAVVTYACLTGQLPFVAETLAALSFKIAAGEFLPPTQSRAELPRAVDLWMKRGLDRKPEGRFDSATAMAEALELALRRSPDAPRLDDPSTGTVLMSSQASTTPSPGETLDASSGAGPVAAPVTSGMAPTVVGAPSPLQTATVNAAPGTWAGSPYAQSTLSPMSATGGAPHGAHAPSPKRSRAPWVLAAVVVLLGVGGAGLFVAGQASSSAPADSPTKEAGPAAVPEADDADEVPTKQATDAVDEPVPAPTAEPDEATPVPKASSAAPSASPPPPSRPTPKPFVRPVPKSVPKPGTDNPFKTRR